MIDSRHETFLALCRIKSYTKTAKELFITQPAVSQHIKYLETQYGGELFVGKGRDLFLSSRGRLLYDFLKTYRSDSEFLTRHLQEAKFGSESLCFGATLSIGEFVCAQILTEVLAQHPKINVEMQVENTESLLKKLDNAEISFALIEGFFDKAKYGYRLFSKEKFIAICSADSALCGKTVALTDLLEQRIILREKGSGTREIFEHILKAACLTTDSFAACCELASLRAIKELVQSDLGITFLYETAAKEELDKGLVKKINIADSDYKYEFNFVYLKNTVHEEIYLAWYRFFLSALE